MAKDKRGNLRLIQGHRGNAAPDAPVEQKPKPYALISLVTVLCATIFGALVCAGVWWVASQFLVASQMQLVTLQSSTICGGLFFGCFAYLFCYIVAMERERYR